MDLDLDWRNARRADVSLRSSAFFGFWAFRVAFTSPHIVTILRCRHWALGVFDPSNFGSCRNRYTAFMTNEVPRRRCPLFIFMGG